MSDNVLRHLVATVIVLLLIYQIGSFIATAYGVLWGAIAAVVIVAMLYFSARLAKSTGNHSFWFVLLVLIFSIFSIGFILWRELTEDIGWLDRMVNLAPFVASFAAPVVLLLIVYFELRNRMKSED